ncbi:polysaccharide deacetylase family protein [Halalkalicoccus salilacus]|uniref:polysaccharide deacetylase family protein n=1 Tax=Halalkalicoccus TaxID=332246 RepID=UPI002F965B25
MKMGRNGRRRSFEATQNVLSFDLEHWYTATLLRDEVSDPIDRIETSVEIVLDLLRRFETRATFFSVGEVVEEYPELIRAVAEEGHEIASHGHTHTPLFELSPEAFREELELSATAIEDATGVRPDGFRAPNFSVTPRTQWAFDALEAIGHRYDSSVFPVRTPMYGVRGAPIRPYRVDPRGPFEDANGANGLLELPLAVFHPWVRLPTAGGFYARLLPTAIIKRGVRNLNRRGIPAMLYFHPWEFNPAVRTDEPPPHKRFVSFHGIERTREKLAELLSTFEFTTSERLVEAYG